MMIMMKMMSVRLSMMRMVVSHYTHGYWLAHERYSLLYVYNSHRY